MSKWREVRIENVCLVGDGAHAKIKRHKDGVLYLTSKNFKGQGLDLSKTEYISKEDYKKHFCKQINAITNVQKGDLVFSIIGSIGFPYVVKESDCFGLSSSVAILRPNQKKINSEFLYYWITSEIFQAYIRNIRSGVAQGFLSLGMVKKLPVLLYPLITQENIADVLSTYDELIENNNRRIEILEKTAQEIYQEWFVRMRFPGHENTRFIKGIPEGWDVKKVGDIGEVVTGKTPPTLVEEYYGEEIMFVKTPDMHGNIFTAKTEVYLSKEGSESQPSKLLPENSIMVSCIGTGGVVAINMEPSHTNQQINSIILNNTELREWAYFTLKTMKKTIELFGATGATMTNLSKGKFEKLKILYPTDKLLIDFNNCTKDMFEQIKHLILKNQNLIKQRDLLLPRLMNGTIEVK